MSIVPQELIACVNFAAIKHSKQRRRDPDKTPYINHPIGVAHILSWEGGVTDLAILQAALLHDTVEDTDTTLEEIEQHFGKEVRDIVGELTDDKNLQKPLRKQLQVDNTPHISDKAKLVRLADKIDNIRNLKRKKPDEQKAQMSMRWSKEIVKGITGVNEKLEELLDDLLTSMIK